MNSKRLKSWRGRVVLVTGASSGIGEATARRAAKEGAKVALLARREEKLEAIADEIRKSGGVAEVFVCDVSDRAAIERSLDAIDEKLGAVEVAVLNAGFGRHARFVDHDIEDVSQMLDVNLLAPMRFAQPLIRQMRERGEGWLVFMASIAGLLPVPGEAAYSATKFGLVGFAEALSMEVEEEGIHVLTVCPGAVRTEFVPEEEELRLPEAARQTMIDASEVVDAVFTGLAKAKGRIVVPKKLEVASTMRGLLPSLVRSGTKRATRDIL